MTHRSQDCQSRDEVVAGHSRTPNQRERSEPAVGGMAYTSIATCSIIQKIAMQLSSIGLDRAILTQTDFAGLSVKEFEILKPKLDDLNFGQALEGGSFQQESNVNNTMCSECVS